MGERHVECRSAHREVRAKLKIGRSGVLFVGRSFVNTQRRGGRVLRAVWVALLLWSGSPAAHHSNSAYDTEKSVQLTGTVTRWQLVNPHSGLWLEVVDAQGTSRVWGGEFTGTLDLYRKFMWNKDTFKPGDRVTLHGHPARDGRPFVMATKVVFASGTIADLAGT